MLHQESISLETRNGINGSESHPHFANHQPQGLELNQQLQRLEEIIVLDGLKVPLTHRTIVDEEQLLSQLLAVERSIPETVRAAEEILKSKDEILARAHQYAQELVKSAEQRAAQIADELTIIQQAEREAQFLQKQVEAEVESLRQRSISEIERARRQAQQELDAQRQSTQAECEQIHREADVYADRVLKDLEVQLGTMLKVINNGRSHLKQSAS
jgi:cell division septum initiation protein DivIVA